MAENIRIIPDQHIRVLSAEIDALRQEIAESRAQRRAVAMDQYQALLSWVASIEQEWRIQPTTADLRRAWKEGKVSIG